MITMVIIAGAALMLTFALMRTTASRTRRDRDDGIRWRGIDWSAAEQDESEKTGDHFKKSQD
jgi:hypothetical protein